MNLYLREMNVLPIPAEFSMWQEDGDILITPDRCRWRIERTPTVADLVRVGDIIETSYGTGGLVIEISKHLHCCCPHRAISTTTICEQSWDPPEQTMEYHRELTTWSIIYVVPGSQQTKTGRFFENDYCYLNELVAVGNRILQLFEDNQDEVFVVNKNVVIKPMQLTLF